MSSLGTLSVALTHATHPRNVQGCVAVVIDQLRAASTITAALASGAHRVIPVPSVEEALQRKSDLRRRDPARSVLLGGERGGVLIPGFDLGNSPREYTPERVAGADIVFTTTNGTAALHATQREGHAADQVLVACLSNVGSCADVLAHDPRRVWIICAGTHGLVSADDALVAGALVERLTALGRPLGDDAARMCLETWRAAKHDLRAALEASLGGRGLIALGQDDDLEWCARVDTTTIVPRLDAEGSLIPA